MYYLFGSLFFALLVTLFLVSKIAEMLQAKKPGMGYIFLASLIGALAATLTLVPLGIFIEDIDPNIMLMLTVAIMFIVSSMAFKYINIMNWGGAITTNIANIVISLIAVTAAIVLNGGSLEESFKRVSSAVTSNTQMATNIATGDFSLENEANTNDLNDNQDLTEADEASIEMDEVSLDEEPVITEMDLLPAGTVKEINDSKRQVFVEPKYRIVSVGSIRSVVGRPIRILKKNGKKISGSLQRISGNDAVVMQRLEGGVATTPISLASIKQLEVYR